MNLTTQDFQRNSTDWEIVRTLYVVQGLTAGQIKAQPEFKDLTSNQIESRATQGGWRDQREKFLTFRMGQLAGNVAEQMRKGADAARSALAFEIGEEIRLYQGRPKEKDVTSQKERLDILTRIVNMADKIFPLDMFGMPDVNKQGFAGLTAINIGQGSVVHFQNPVVASQTPSAVSTLEESKNVTTGNLDESRGTLAGEVSFQVTSKTGNEPIEAEVREIVEDPNKKLSEEEAEKATREAMGYEQDEQERKKDKVKKGLHYKAKEGSKTGEIKKVGKKK